MILLLGSQLALANPPVEGFAPPPRLGEFAPTALPYRHGPDGPGEMPDEGYGFKEEKGNGLGWVGLGLLGGAGISALAMRSSKVEMESATTVPELEDAYTKNKRRGYTTYSLLGGSALFFGLALAF